MSGIRGLTFDPATLVQGDLVPDALWSRECLAFNVQVDLGGTAARAIQKVLDGLHSGLPAQHVVPATALHISVLNIIQARSAASPREKAALWDQHRERWLEAIDHTANRTAPFDIELTQLVPAPSGVIAVAHSCPEIVDLRRRLARAMHLDAVPVPELCHTTVLRFGTAPPKLPELTRVLAHLDIRVTTHVTAIRTVRELVYPSLVRETVRDHPFQKTQS